MLNGLQIWALLGSVLPLLVAAATKAETAGGVKGVLAALLAALLGVGVEGVHVIANGGTFDWRPALAVAVLGFIVHQASHFGLLRDSKVQAALQALGAPKDVEDWAAKWIADQRAEAEKAEAVPGNPDK